MYWRVVFAQLRTTLLPAYIQFETGPSGRWNWLRRGVCIWFLRGGRGGAPLAISAISLWEIAWLVKNGRIETTLSVDAFVKRCAGYVEVLPITEAIAVRLGEFPESYPADPQDRLIEETAMVEGRPLLTQDRLIVKSGLVPLAG